ncbi:MAG: prepilin peptidase [Lachnospiraceae bacterium]|nr:prepilin peptidase [Lachnospiraceae bacterium]
MFEIIIAILYALLAVGTCILMIKATNKRIESGQPLEYIETEVQPYKLSSRAICMIIICIALFSGFIGYWISDCPILTLIKIGICYMAVLGAMIMDWKIRAIPNYIPLALFGLRLVILVYELIFVDMALEQFVSSVIGCAVVVLFLFIANRVSKGGIGAGDVKLLAGIGFMCDMYVVLTTLLLGLICCIIISMTLVAFKKINMKAHVPFGPFIYMGFAAMCLLTL